MTGKIATIELYVRDDGEYDLNCIHWSGKAWDGFWQYYVISRESAKRILEMLPNPKVPDTCKDCEYFFDFNHKPPYICRISRPQIRTFDGETIPEKMTVETMMSDRWLTETPDWCPLKEEENERSTDVIA